MRCSIAALPCCVSIGLEDRLQDNINNKNPTPAWLAQVQKIESQETAEAIQAIEAVEGKQEVITDESAVGAALKAIADTMPESPEDSEQ